MITNIPNYVVNAVASTEMNPNPFPPYEPPEYKPKDVSDTAFQEVFNAAMKEIEKEKFKESYHAAATERYGDENMKDVVVIQSLRNRGVDFSNLNEVLNYEAVEHKPRVLDKPPKKLSFVRPESIVPYGCCTEFVITYNHLKQSFVYEQYQIELGDYHKYCDAEVFLTLSTLSLISKCCIQEKAEACSDLFKWILQINCDVLTTGRLQKAIPNYLPINYWAEELNKGIKICVFNESPVAIYWETLCGNEGYYKGAIKLGKDVISQHCKTESDVEPFLKPLRKAAREDEKFTEGLFKKGTNKYITPILYYLKDTNPKVLDPDWGGE